MLAAHVFIQHGLLRERSGALGAFLFRLYAMNALMTFEMGHHVVPAIYATSLNEAFI